MRFANMTMSISSQLEWKNSKNSWLMNSGRMSGSSINGGSEENNEFSSCESSLLADGCSE